mmetsp:Transcript_354/g.642  ORF Transcript_354/g.642 Transcript_354/m.642 type:complete len:103 (+) Transcript_354:177-485(+)
MLEQNVSVESEPQEQRGAPSQTTSSASNRLQYAQNLHIRLKQGGQQASESGDFDPSRRRDFTMHNEHLICFGNQKLSKILCKIVSMGALLGLFYYFFLDYEQ